MDNFTGWVGNDCFVVANPKAKWDWMHFVSDFWEAWIDEKSNLGLENNTFVNMFFANKDTTYVNMCAGESTMRTDILVFLHVFCRQIEV